MTTCEVCGNDYDKPITVNYQGKTRSFDCFECAIHALAPECAHCGCKIVGHGVQDDETVYCCAHCAKQAGVEGVSDHVSHAAMR